MVIISSVSAPLVAFFDSQQNSTSKLLSLFLANFLLDDGAVFLPVDLIGMEGKGK
jgi:hypothetical protein